MKTKNFKKSKKSLFELFINLYRIFKANKSSKISYLSFVDNNSIIGEKSRIYRFNIITNSSIGSYTYVAPSVKINNTKIGMFCSIASGVKMGLGKHPTNFISTSPAFYSLKNALGYTFVEKNSFEEYSNITIGNDVWIGADVIILDGVEIGDGAIIAAKSLVSKNVPPYSIVGGVPAKILKYRFCDITIQKLQKIKWWEFPLDKLKKSAQDFSDIQKFLDKHY